MDNSEEENVPLICSNTSDIDFNIYSSKNRRKKKITKDSQDTVCYNTTSSSSKKKITQINSDFENEENEIYNSKTNKMNALKMDSNKIMSKESLKKSKSSKATLSHPPYNHQNSNRSDLALIQDRNNGMTSNLETMMHLLKGNMGTGILAMPNAFGNVGLLTGSILLPIIGSIAVHCMHVLVNSHNIVSKRFGLGNIDYEDVAEYSFLCGPKRLKKFSKVFRRIVMLFLILTQIGFCCAYSIFFADTCHSVIKSLTNNQIDYSSHFYMLIELPLMILFCFIRDLKTLSIFSTIANVLQSIGLIIIFIALIENLPSNWDRPQWIGFEKMPLYFGTVVYSFEGIGIVLPLQKEMKKAKSFRGFFGVLNTGMIIVGILYLAMGFFGYLSFGDEVMKYGSITLNLPFTPLYETVKLMFAVSLFFSFALQFYVPINILWPVLIDQFDLDKNNRKTVVFELIFRAFLVIITFLIAAAIPKLDLFISLIGALSSSCLALIFPPIIELLVKFEDENISSKSWFFIVLKDILIIIFGFIGFVTGTYISCKQIYSELFN